MELCSRTSETFEECLQPDETGCGSDQWQRWNEEMVDQFGRWLARIGKALAILFVAVFAGAAMGWF